MSTHAFVPDPGWPTIVELATERWGQPNKAQSQRDDIRFGAKGSKSVKPSVNTWHDHETGEGGGYVEMHRATRGELPPRPHRKGNGALPPWDDIARIYDYHDVDGNLVLQVVRTLSGNPRFRQRRPIGNGKWSWSIKEIPAADRPLYRLPGLRASGDETVWITEGEKDADNLLHEGLIATCSLGGAGKWRDAYAEEFRDKHCIVLQDNDDAGRKHAAMVARSLHGVAASVKLLLLPGLPEKGDVSDWLDASGTREELERLAITTREWCEDDPYEGLSNRLSASTWLSRPLPPVDRLLGDFITTTTRAFLVGHTGLGKTMLGLGFAMGMAFGTGFLHWRSSRPARVLFIDGEMPAELLIQRIRDAARRIGREDMVDNLMVFSTEDAEDIAERYPMLGMFEPLNTEGGQDFLKRLCPALKPDVVIFDNVQALLIGVQKEEETWIPVLPLVQWLTKSRIGQLWIDHTARSTGLQYGTSTKSWRFDTAGLMLPLNEDERDPRETAFTLSFDKARRRTPDNWDEFATHIIRLRDDVWTGEPAEKRNGTGEDIGSVPPSRRVFYDALVAAIGKHGQGTAGVPTDLWVEEALRRGLIEKPPEGETSAQRRTRFRDYRTAKSTLLAAKWILIDGDLVIDLRRRWS